MNDEFERRLEQLAEVPVPAPPTVAKLSEQDRERSTRRARAGMVAVLLIVAAATAGGLVSRGPGGGSEVATAPPGTEPSSSAPRWVEETTRVADATNTYVGTIDNRDAEARDERILARLSRDFREPVGPNDEDYNRLWAALAILDPVPVVDEAGTIVGYWIGHFVTPAELSSSTAGADATVDELLGG
jgi:hypothetical protein